MGHSLPKKLRFEVFKRDAFTCQYCGASAPDAILQVDHIHPVSKGGSDDVLNLITSCQPCNSGKSNRLLSDDAVIVRQRAQLEDAQERLAQLEMLYEWKRSLLSTEDAATKMAAEMIEDITGAFLSGAGMDIMRRNVRRFGIAEVLDAIPEARKYLRRDYDPPGYTSESVDEMIRKVGGICFNRAKERT